MMEKKKCNGLHCRCMQKDCPNTHHADCVEHNPNLLNNESEAGVSIAEQYLFRKFARLYHEKNGRLPIRTDKYDKFNFEMFMMGWEACKKSIIVAHNSEQPAPPSE